LILRVNLILPSTSKFLAVHEVVEDALALLVKFLSDESLEALSWKSSDLLLVLVALSSLSFLRSNDFFLVGLVGRRVFLLVLVVDDFLDGFLDNHWIEVLLVLVLFWLVLLNWLLLDSDLLWLCRLGDDLLRLCIYFLRVSLFDLELELSVQEVFGNIVCSQEVVV